MNLQKLRIETGGLGGDTHVWLDDKPLPYCHKIVITIEAMNTVKANIDLFAAIEFDGKAEVETHVLTNEEKEAIAPAMMTLEPEPHPAVICRICGLAIGYNETFELANQGTVHTKCADDYAMMMAET